MIRRTAELKELPLVNLRKNSNSRRWSQRCFWLGLASFSLACGALSNVSILERMGGTWNGNDIRDSINSEASNNIPVVRLLRRNQLPSDNSKPSVEGFAAQIHVAASNSSIRSQHPPTFDPNRVIQMPAGSIGCMNTRQGISKVADSNGFVCDRRQLEDSECCSRSEAMSPFSCSGCDASIKCCSEFEFCVSCCMRPELSQDLFFLQKNSIHSVLSASTPFEFCQFKCRTSSGSNFHENTYRNSKKHCFGIKKPPIMPGLSVNSDLSVIKEQSIGKSLVKELEHQGLDPYIETPVKGKQSASPRMYPCVVDACGAKVPARYP